MNKKQRSSKSTLFQTYKKSFFFVLRVLITFSLLYLIYRKIDLNFIKDLLYKSNYFYFIAAFLFFILSNITGAIQWYFLLRSQKIKKLSLFYVIKLYLLSAFFNNFLPTNVGGDVVKGYKLIKLKLNKNIIFSSIIWDRFTSIIVLIIFSLLFGYLCLKKQIILTVLLLFILLCLISIFLLNKYNAGKFFLKILNIIKNKKIRYLMEEFLISFKIYLQKSKYILFFYITSFITQFLKTSLMVFVAIAMNLNISLFEVFFIIPLIGIVSSLPISINGMGIKEYVGSFLFLYLNKAKAITTIFITVGNLIVILGNLTGAIFMFDKGKK